MDNKKLPDPMLLIAIGLLFVMGVSILVVKLFPLPVGR